MYMYMYTHVVLSNMADSSVMGHITIGVARETRLIWKAGKLSRASHMCKA